MADIINTRISNDGPRNITVQLSAILDTADIPLTTLLNPTLTAPNFTPYGDGRCTQFRIDRIQYDIEDTMSAYLEWDATVDALAVALVGRGELNFKDIGGLQNNAGAGKTGILSVRTQGYTATGLMSVNLMVDCVKQ